MTTQRSRRASATLKVSRIFLPAILAIVVLALTACEAPAATTTMSPVTATYSASAPRSDASVAQDDWTAAAIANLSLGYSASLDV